jgi:hypothetical protein
MSNMSHTEATHMSTQQSWCIIYIHVWACAACQWHVSHVWQLTYICLMSHMRCERHHVRVTYMWETFHMIRPTQSIMYVPLQVNRSQKSILLIVQYKYLKSCTGDFYSPQSDPPHKIMRYWIYYSTQLCFGFPPDRICQVEMICIGCVPVSKRHFGGAGP